MNPAMVGTVTSRLSSHSPKFAYRISSHNITVEPIWAKVSLGNRFLLSSHLLVKFALELNVQNANLSERLLYTRISAQMRKLVSYLHCLYLFISFYYAF